MPDPTGLHNAQEVIRRIDNDEYGLVTTFRIDAELFQAAEAKELLARAQLRYKKRHELVLSGGDGATMENVEERDRLEMLVKRFEGGLQRAESLEEFLRFLRSAC